MAILSILLSVLAAVCTLIGFLTTPIPVVGAVFSFGAAGVALGGIMLGGKAVSKAKREGSSHDVARIAVVLNVLAFVPALLVAFTCGACNAFVSTGNFQLQRDFQINVGPGMPGDAGGNALPPPARARDPEDRPGAPAGPGKPGPNQPGQPGQQDQPDQPGGDKANPPSPRLPPPPLPAGPGN